MRLKRFLGIVVPLIFLIVMSWYNYLLLQSYNYTIFDLGLSYRLMYLFSYHHTIIFYGNDIIFSPDPFAKFIFVPLSISLYLYNSLLTPLILQTLIIALGGYAVFRIAQLRTRSLLISLTIEIAYFLYPVTYGYTYHGGNYSVLIEGFILIGYMFYIQEKKAFAFLAFAMASLTNMWAPLIVLAFLFVDLITQNRLYYFHNFKTYYSKIKQSKINIKSILFYVGIVVFNGIIFAQTLKFGGGIHSLLSSSYVSSSMTAQSTILHSNIFQNFPSNFGSNKLPFLSEVLSPVLFLPVLTPYFVLIMLYMLIAWNTNYIGTYYVLQQYPYLFASFVFIGTIHFFKELTDNPHAIGYAKKLGILILVASIVSFSLYSPFSISNFQNSTVQNETHISNFDTHLTYGLSLIPVNSSV